MKKRQLVLTVLLVFFSLSILAAEEDLNQYGNGSSFARVTAVEGTLNVKRDVNEMKGVERNFVVEAMDEISTEYASRAVIQFIDGSMIKLDENTKIDFLKIGGDEKNFSFLVRVFSGKIYADISDDETFKEREFRVDTKDATVFLLSAGRYTVDVLDYLSKVKTIAGLAEVSLENGSKLVRSGEKADVDGSRKSVVVRNFNTFYLDDFTRWATANYNRQLAESTQYVPDQIKHYVSDLDNNGNWYYDTEVERYVWRPGIISVDWTPYTNGYWAYSPYGSTWVSSYSWGWAPFHYGSWYFSGSLGWCWNPGYHYSPAWVSWSCWDNYIGWYPYNHHHHGHVRGVVVRHNIRDRVVAVRGNNFYNRHVTVVRNVRPNRSTVVRSVKPIAPNPVKVVSKPYRAISTAIKNPVKVRTVKSRQVKPIRSNVTSVKVRTNSQVKPIRQRTTIKTTERSNSVIKGRNVKPGKTSGTSRSIKVTPRGTKTNSRSIKVTPRGTSSSSRTIKTRPSSSSSSSTKGRSIKIKSPTVRDRYVRPQSSSSSKGRTIKTNTYRSEIKRPSYSSSSSRTVKRSTPSRSYTTPKTSTKSYSKPSRSSYSYTKPSKSSSKTYTAPKRSSSKSYSKPSRTTTRSSSSTSSSSSSRSSRRR